DTLWLEVSQYPELIAQFSSGNQTRIKQGLTAKAPLEGWHYGPKEIVKKFQIHHRVAIEYGGSVYDIDNLRIVTPRLHDEIHYRR
ncbi:TPA: HNH endonuclease signature motif containing protein, partial [Escherichia coli]